jgi:hypothetical protein
MGSSPAKETINDPESSHSIDVPNILSLSLKVKMEKMKSRQRAHQLGVNTRQHAAPLDGVVVMIKNSKVLRRISHRYDQAIPISTMRWSLADCNVEIISIQIFSGKLTQECDGERVKKERNSANHTQLNILSPSILLNLSIPQTSKKDSCWSE